LIGTWFLVAENRRAKDILDIPCERVNTFQKFFCGFPDDSVLWRIKSEYAIVFGMDEGRKRVLAIVAGILVARHQKTTDELFDSRPSPRTESLVSAAVQWAERIMRKIDSVFG